MSTRTSIDLIRQAAECDANYIRLLKLMPRLHRCREQMPPDGLLTAFQVGDEPTDSATVAVRVLDAQRYTTHLEIAQSSTSGAGRWDPLMQVRVYHDAHTAEVVSFQGHRHLQPWYDQPNPWMYQADEKLQVNRFLGEWLSHCLAHGRSMPAPSVPLNIC